MEKGEKMMVLVWRKQRKMLVIEIRGTRNISVSVSVSSWKEQRGQRNVKVRISVSKTKQKNSHLINIRGSFLRFLFLTQFSIRL